MARTGSIRKEIIEAAVVVKVVNRMFAHVPRGANMTRAS